MHKKVNAEKRISMTGYLIFLLVFFISACILIYPAVASWWNDNHQMGEAIAYQNEIEKLPDTDYSGYIKQAQEYNQAILNSGAILTDPFDFKAASAKVNATISNYDDMLNYTEIMATIEIPKIEIDLPIYHGTEENTLSKGIGHLQGTSLPVGGTGTHCVLTGHTGLPGKTLFTNLTKLKLGDLFYIHVMNEKLTYQVNDISVVLPDDVSKISLDSEQDYVTLITCTPYGVNDHRLLVQGTRIYPEELSEEEIKQIEENNADNIKMSGIEIAQLVSSAIAFILFIIMLIMTISTARQNRRNRSQTEK